MIFVLIHLFNKHLIKSQYESSCGKESALHPLIADNLYPGSLEGHSMRKQTINHLRPFKVRVGWGKA